MVREDPRAGTSTFFRCRLPARLRSMDFRHGIELGDVSIGTSLFLDFSTIRCGRLARPLKDRDLQPRVSAGSDRSGRASIPESRTYCLLASVVRPMLKCSRWITRYS